MRSSPQGERRSVDRGTCGPDIQPRKFLPPGRRRCKEKRKAPSGASISRDAVESRAVRDPVHVRKHLAREPGGPVLVRSRWNCGTRREVQGHTPTMNEHRKSDSLIVPMKSPNKAGQPVAEGPEGRGLAKGNLLQQNAPRTQRRQGALSALERVRLAAARDRKMRFTALLHHIYALPTLRAAYLSLKREAAAGVDGETWRDYGERLEENLRDLAERVKRGAYRAKPVRRVFIPKPDGRQRPLGVTALEDKLLQRATVEVLNVIYETDFLGFSYGFRPGRSPHDALDALYAGLLTRKVNWVLDLDIRGFFDAIDHGWLVKFIEHRIADQRVVRLIQKWLNAGVLEEGKRTRVEEGTPQGGSATPRTQKVTLGGWRTVQLTWSRRATAGRGCRRSRNTVADNDIIVAYKNLLDDQTHDPLALDYVERISAGAQSSQERRGGLCQVQELSAVTGLINDRLQLGAQGLFALA